MAQDQHAAETALEIDRLATQLAKDPHSKAFLPLADEYGKVGMWQEAAGVLEDGLKLYPGFITAMVALGRAYDHVGQVTKARAILEESIKLSPENLRAHRTLIKIYQSQGLNEPAVQSCAVILAVNPRDEEALSVQSALGGPFKHKKELERPKPTAPVTSNLSADQAVAPPASADLAASTPAEPEITSTNPHVVVTDPTATVLHSHDQPAEQLAMPGLVPHATEIVVMPPPSPRADVVAQLESWLRGIQSRRHDHATTNRSHPKFS